MGSLWPRSGTIERYADDIRAAGAKAYFFQGGTTTSLTVYRDSGDGSSHPNPVVADARGRWPDVFIPYSVAGYDVQVKTAEGVQLTYSISVPNPNPIAVTPPPATDGLQTGMIIAELVNATKAGFVRLNGRTIGNAVSGATERANADTSDLYDYLWNAVGDAIAPVSGGRGASSTADFAANKTLQLPNGRGAALVGLDDMGNSAAGLFTAQSFAAGNSAILPGSACGGNSRTLTSGNLPAHAHTGTTASSGSHNHGGATASGGAHTHTGTTGLESVNHTHSGTTGIESANHTHGFTAVLGVTSSFNAGGNPTGAANASAGTTGTQSANHTHSFTTGNQSADHTHDFTTNSGGTHSHTISSDGAHTHTFTTDSTGSGTAVDNMPNSMLVTWYIKL